MNVVVLSSRAFVLACAVVAAAVTLVAGVQPLPTWLLAAEVFVTIACLFLLGSFRYQIDKNVLTYGMAIIIVTTFACLAWPTSQLRADVARDGWWATIPFLRTHILSWHGLENLVHIDTMSFILGLTLFVAVVAQTRLLESITITILRRNKGHLLATVVAVTAVVAASSGVLDGVSMIGLTIRTLVIVLFLASMPTSTVRYAVMVCTIVTTVCGMWLAYGEPPNLIMKANLRADTGEPYLTDAFFLRYCLPAAVASYLVVYYNLRKRLGNARVQVESLDFLDVNAASLRFLQASRHGEVNTAVELVENSVDILGHETAEEVQERIRGGTTLGIALVQSGVPPEIRIRLLGEFVSDDLATDLDAHYVAVIAGDEATAHAREKAAARALRSLVPQQDHAQRMALVGLLTFIVLIVAHARDHRIPLFVASFAGFAVSAIGIASIPKTLRLALHEARLEYAEYYFLFPLFLSVTLLTEVGFFDDMQEMLRAGVAYAGPAHVAFAQFATCTALSAILDNNVVADFGSRALEGLEIGLVHLFAMAQIAGYAAGGCLTHIGSAQSVVAFAFIRRDIDEHYTPIGWIREMAPVMAQIAVVLTVIIYAEGLLLDYAPAASSPPAAAIRLADEAAAHVQRD